jgi:hypothetical protein
MKNSETDYLNTLFASSSDVTDEAEVEIPLLDVPDTLSGKLYAIAESAPVVLTPNYTATTKRGLFESWPKITSIAASLLVAIMGVQFYQQQQTLKQLEQAQNDLTTALHYLGEANRITRGQVLDSLNDNINKAGVIPAMEIGRDAVVPNFKRRKLQIKIPNRTL